MGDSSTLDMLKRLIVGKRGRGRADRLLVTGADGVAKPIEIKPQRNVSAYVDLVESLQPVWIEAYVGNELVATAGEAPAAPPASPPAPSKKTPKTTAEAPPAPRLKGRMGATATIVKDLTTHNSNLIAAAYKQNSADQKERDRGLWETFRQAAQHQADRAANAELRVEQLEKGIRIRDRQILELNRVIAKMQHAMQELAIEASGDDPRTKMFMKFLDAAGMKDEAAKTTTATNGATKKGHKPS